MRAILRWALADLRTHRGQAASLALATVGVTAALLLSAALFQFAASPWQQVFTETRGNHIWLRLTGGSDTSRLPELPGVQSVSGPYRTVPVTATSATTTAALDLRGARPDEPSAQERQFLTGRWLGSAPDEVVLDRSTAQALWVRPGDTLPVQTSPARYATLRVVGVMSTSEAGYEEGERPGTAWASPATLNEFTAGPGTGGAPASGRTVGLRLDDAADTDFVVQQAVAAVGPEHVVRLSTWQEARAAVAEDNRLLGQLLRVFGLGSLLAAAVAVTGGVGGRVLGQVRDISVLKVIGMTPRQVAVMFFVQHSALALAGVTVGSLAVRTLGAHVPGPIGEAVAYGRTLPGAAAVTVAIGVGAVLVIAAATAFAAWRAARVPPSPVARIARPAARRMARSARLALRWGTPPQLVLGWRGATHRRDRFTASVARLALPVLMMTVALAAVATLDGLRNGDTGHVNPPAPLTVRQEHGLDAGALARIKEHPEVRAVYPAAEVTALIPGQTRSVTLRGLGTEGHAYPFVAVEGRAPSAPDEAVAGQGLLDTTRVRVGQWVRLTVGGTPHILHIVGRSIEPEHSGLVISTTLDTLRDGGTAHAPQSYALMLRPGADPATVARALSADLPGVDIRRSPPPVASPGLVSGVLAGLIGVLALITVAELAASVSSALRLHTRELPALRAIGLTPRQLAGVVVTNCAVTATVAAAVGIVAGLVVARPLIDLEGHASGVGAGIAVFPPVSSLLLTAVGLVVAAVALAVVPALRAERRRVPDPGAGLG
ncbi:FtsX-like permease family protein [Streptomyces sp. NPDC058001]|uniref:ABC transporter permease n=1 Tax=Streptomyces sp. NPDC058001 TaxID=3346300 RepID=UPI0036E57DA5